MNGSHKWIFAGSLVVLFFITLLFSRGATPSQGVAQIKAVLTSPALKPSVLYRGDMVTPKVTIKNVVTEPYVTNVTTMSPSGIQASPALSPDKIAGYSGQTPIFSNIPTGTPHVSSSTPLTSEVSSPAPLAVSPTPNPSKKININTASLSELDNIIGVGPVIAQRIIDYRTGHGPFQKIEDVINVKGIGDATFQKMKDQIAI